MGITTATLERVLVTSLQFFIMAVSAPFLAISTLVLKIYLDVIKGTKPVKDPSVILITGANSGIGAEVARQYAQPGRTLLLTARNVARLQTVKDDCEALGAKVETFAVDVVDRKKMEQQMNRWDDEHTVDLVIANAGVTEVSSGVGYDIVESSRFVYSVNVDGVHNTILPFVPRMQKRQEGQIALISSVSALGPITELAVYASTKAAIKSYGEGLRARLYKDNVRVNTVLPGYVKTPMLTDHEYPISTMLEVTEDYAAKAIIEGLARDDALIAFPWHLATGTWIMNNLLPPFARDIFARSGLIKETGYLY